MPSTTVSWPTCVCLVFANMCPLNGVVGVGEIDVIWHESICDHYWSDIMNWLTVNWCFALITFTPFDESLRCVGGQNFVNKGVLKNNRFPPTHISTGDEIGIDIWLYLNWFRVSVYLCDDHKSSTLFKEEEEEVGVASRPHHWYSARVSIYSFPTSYWGFSSLAARPSWW